MITFCKTYEDYKKNVKKSYVSVRKSDIKDITILDYIESEENARIIKVSLFDSNNKTIIEAKNTYSLKDIINCSIPVNVPKIVYYLRSIIEEKEITKEVCNYEPSDFGIIDLNVLIDVCI